MKASDPSGKKVKLVWDPERKEYVPKKGVKIPIVEEALKGRNTRERLNKLLWDDSDAGRFTWESTKGFLLYSAEKAEEIAWNYQDIDKAMKWGYNWELGSLRDLGCHRCGALGTADAGRGRCHPPVD